MGELPGRDGSRVDLLEQHLARAETLLEIHADAGGARQQGGLGLIEQKGGGMIAALRRGGGVLQRDRRFARPGRPDQQRAAAALDAPAEQRIQPVHAAANRFRCERGRVLRGHQPRKYDQSAFPDGEVVVAADEVAAAKFQDLDFTTGLSVGRRSGIRAMTP